MTPQIPNYEIKQVLGEGGMATVYLAHNIKFGTNVALKLLKKEFIHNSNIRARFIAEARNMFRMSHPQIIKVTDLIDDGDTVAFVMEYIEGETLKDYLERKGKLNSEEIGGLLEQMLSALEYAHDQGLVHRDIKPSNFIITPQGRLKLLDFGIAKQTNTASAEYTITGTNQRMGTAMYMSPEQIHETRSVTPRSDIYSLGVVLWQMVTGQKPYSTETLSAFQLQIKIVNEPLPLTGTNWDNLIQKATEKDSQHRYSDINSFRSAWQKGQNDFNESRDSGDKTVIEQQLEKPVSEIAEKPTIRTRKRISKIDQEPTIPPRKRISKTAKEPIKPPRKINFYLDIFFILLALMVLGYYYWNNIDGLQDDFKRQFAITENEYESIISSVKIGDQEWQMKNLDVDRFRNGDAIPHATTAEEWKAAGERGEPAWCYYDNDAENGKIYGKLYNWYAVNDARGLAPTGWHIPTDEEWTTLTDYLGGEGVAGGKMKTRGTTYWKSPNTDATNESGFSALPGGYRSSDGSFDNIRNYAFFWSITENDFDVSLYAWTCALYTSGGSVSRDFNIYNDLNKSVGATVRCLRD